MRFGPDEIANLPALAMSHPKAATERARAILHARSPARERTYALHALGIIERDGGRVGPALRYFRRGLRIAEAESLDDRRVELGASLGTALALAGRRREALDVFEAALDGATRHERARVLVRRGAARTFFGDHTGAFDDNDEAARILGELDEPVWESRAHQNAGSALVSLGRFDEGEARLARAQAMAEQHGDHYSAIVALSSRGDCAHRTGRVPDALRMLYEARQRHERLGVVPPEILRDLAVVQLSAGLTEEAAAAADHLVAVLEQDPASALRRADGFIAAAMVHLGSGNAARAIDLARRARRSSRRQGHVEAEQHARFVLLRAQFAAGTVTKRHARAAAELAGELGDRYASERLDALVLAGRLAVATGLDDLARSCFSVAAGERHRGPALRRATAWYARAQLAALNGDQPGMLRAGTRGLDVLDTHALSFGALELRARATIHGTDLAALATRQMAANGTPRQLLYWMERWRSTVHALPVPPTPDDPVLAAELGRLRAASRDLASMADARHEARRNTVEDRIRRYVHSRRGDTSARRRRFDVDELLDALGRDTTMVSIIGISGKEFHITVARRGRVRRFRGGRVDDVFAELDHARFALRSVVLAPEPAAKGLLEALDSGLASLERTVLGPAARELGDGPVVLVPPSRLQAAPWGALPSLRRLPVAVAPSATAWLRAREAASSERAEHTVLIAGDDLESSGAEVPVLASMYPDATVLTGDDATVDAALRTMDGASLVHIGAHGRYRGDSPMFSSLELADGPITVLDVEQLARPPHRLLLTACESGVGSPTGDDELLGLASTLSALGTAGILASIVPISDAGSVPFSVAIHERVRAGDDLPTALLAAREAADDPLSTATSWSFLGLGAA
ncbi:CHAT domain-containing protein [Actinobacteria bacterium YIM 96077]|uniref:CHAT domain-containing protein n=1 Tax=Phytoactinopolyspora halophila TaxID=1981511 RepID=A0A329R367_9ACTN|nr:CHAT domain-containing tetratricopeptide repeat protein [Phytoactinopolyspora halophila]AYY11555.1 CHAT domain-containing protein [Actinobacteria bacterium YIM 96077]RAW17962.1 hypothetical protein DPM12_03730 [Phytoactinopolyspora halophila]